MIHPFLQLISGTVSVQISGQDAFMKLQYDPVSVSKRTRAYPILKPISIPVAKIAK